MALNPRDVVQGDGVSGFVGALMGRLKERQDEQAKLRQIFSLALAEQQAKEAFPSPEDQAKKRILQLAGEARRLPLQVAPANEPLQSFPSTDQNLASFRSLASPEAATSREMKILQYILPRSAAGGVRNVFAFDPATGETRPSPGGSNLSQYDRVVPMRMSPEEMGERKKQTETAKQRTDLQARLRELDQAEQGMTALFEQAKQKVPPIGGAGKIPGILPIMKGVRTAGSFLGSNEAAKGFTDTFAVQARQLLRTLEKGGRYTDQDVTSIVEAALPKYAESDTARENKLNESLRNIRQERAVIQRQLSSPESGLGSGTSPSQEEIQAELRRRGLR